MNKRIMPAVLTCLVMIWGLTGCSATTGFAHSAGQGKSDKEQGTLKTAPNVPPPLTRGGNKTVVLHFEAKEYIGDIADGVKYNFWSFNGTVPGPMVRVRVRATRWSFIFPITRTV